MQLHTLWSSCAEDVRGICEIVARSVDFASCIVRGSVARRPAVLACSAVPPRAQHTALIGALAGPAGGCGSCGHARIAVGG
jgi:hypothetical protein